MKMKNINILICYFHILGIFSFEIENPVSYSLRPLTKSTCDGEFEFLIAPIPAKICYDPPSIVFSPLTEILTEKNSL